MVFVTAASIVFVAAIVIPIVIYRRVADLVARLDAIESRLRRLEHSREPSVTRPAVGRAPESASGTAADRRVEPISGGNPAWMPESPAPSAQAPTASAASIDVGPHQHAITLEAEIGSRWMLVVGTIVLVLGVALFVKYSFDRHWITEQGRVAIGTAVGICLWVAGVRFAKRGYTVYGDIIAGGGIAIVFLSAYAAHALYDLVTPRPAFIWMAATVAAATWTGDRQRSIGLALLAVVFGFAAPFLVGGDADSHAALFTFDATLIGATLILTRRHGWPILALATFWLACASFGVWFGLFYTPDQFVSTETYLTVACALFILIRREHGSGGGLVPTARHALATAPVLYYVASIAVLFGHSVPLLVYLIVVTMIVVAGAPTTGRAWIRLAVWAAVALPLFAWLPRHTAGGWYVASLATAIAIYLLHLFGQFGAVEGATTVPDAEAVLFHANGIGLLAFTYVAIDANAGSTATLAFVLAAWNAAFALGAERRARVFVHHSLALAFTFVAVGIALALTGPWITVAWAAEGAAVVWIGIITRRRTFEYGGAILLFLAVGRLVVLQFGETLVSFTPIVNSRSLTGATIVALMYGLAALYRKHGDRQGEEAWQWRAIWLVSANVVTIGLLTADIYSFWKLREEETWASFSRELMVSLAWTVYAMALVAIGFGRRVAVLRYLALALFGLTLTKLFTVDLLELDGVYRITGFVVLGLVLLVASFLYQRYRQQLNDYASS